MEIARPDKPRISAVDIARGVALVAMAIYHFQWDLEFFGYVERGTTNQGGWKLFARAIASSFLFLAGASLVLAHGSGFRARSFVKRLARVVAAAAIITVATWLATPDTFIFFGILHAIALSSLVGLAFLRIPALVSIVAGCLVIVAPLFARSPLFDHPVLLWVGLSSSDPVSNDYVPMFPWFGPFLIGLGVAKWAQSAGFFEWLSQFRFGNWALPVGFAGRHSLAFYLVHQPVLIGIVWLFAQIAPPQIETREVQFLNSCNRSCGETGSEEFCGAYCVCMLDALESEDRLGDVFARRQDDALHQRLEQMARTCSISSGPPE